MQNRSDAHLIVNETLLLLDWTKHCIYNEFNDAKFRQTTRTNTNVKLSNKLLIFLVNIVYICEKYEDAIAIEFEALLLNIKRRSLSRSEMLKSFC